MDEHARIEFLAEVHTEAARLRLASTPFADGVMPVYADLYLDGDPYLSIAVVPDENAFADLCTITKRLNADAIAFTTDSFVVAAGAAPGAASASLQSRFEVGDPDVFEAVSVMIGTLDDGFLAVQMPYARSAMDGLEFHEFVTTGLESDDDIQGHVTEALLGALNGVSASEADRAVRELASGTPLEGDRMAVLLHGASLWRQVDSLTEVWARCGDGFANVGEESGLVELLDAPAQIARVVERSGR
jgi:hypothetical protein